jgi:hypothetical protein
MKGERRFPPERIVALLQQHGGRYDAVVAELGCSRATVYNAAKAAGVVNKRVHTRKHYPRPIVTRARFEHPSLSGAAATMPAYDNPALMQGRTIYPSTVVHPRGVKHALKSGVHAAKIGGVVMKGDWRGLPVFTLSLEERATCPMSCRHWRSCYGNHMHLSERLQHGPDLEWRLERELGWLEVRCQTGFVVRLHVIGDFYSVEYVNFWRRMIANIPTLRVYGYTARWDYEKDPIARALMDFAHEQWAGERRFAIRFSNAPAEHCTTITIEHPYQKPDDAILCPQQTGQTESCSTCALCWSTTRRIAFLQH